MYRCIACLTDFIDSLSFISLDKKIGKVLDAKFGAGIKSFVYFTHRPLYYLLCDACDDDKFWIECFSSFKNDCL